MAISDPRPTEDGNAWCALQEMTGTALPLRHRGKVSLRVYPDPEAMHPCDAGHTPTGHARDLGPRAHPEPLASRVTAAPPSRRTPRAAILCIEDRGPNDAGT